MKPTKEQVAEQAKWEKILEKEGLGMQAGKPNWLVYGHEFGATEDAGQLDIVSSPTVGAVKQSYYAKRRVPRQIAKARVWGNSVESAPETPEWGYVGGYDNNGRRVRPVSEDEQ